MKKIKLITSITAISALTSSWFLVSVQAKAQNSVTQEVSIKSFIEWCEQKKQLPAETRKTVDVLLQKAGTENCQLANPKIRSLSELNLESNQISDVKPLAGLTNLTTLFLGGNQISDVKPLAGLTKLTRLSLDSNQISKQPACPVNPESICTFNKPIDIKP